jgi:hypothetical protein
MKLYLCSVRLGDSANHIVPNKQVTIPEIAVLKKVHGDAAVRDIRPQVDKATKKPLIKLDKDSGAVWTDAQERERLILRYQVGDGKEGINIDKLFGALGALPRTLREIGIDPQAAADELRRQAEEMSQSAARLADEEDDAPAEDEEAFFADVVEEDKPLKTKVPA